MQRKLLLEMQAPENWAKIFEKYIAINSLMQ